MKSKLSCFAILLSIGFLFSALYFFYQTYLSNLLSPIGQYYNPLIKGVNKSTDTDSIYSTIGFFSLFFSIVFLMLGHREFFNMIRATLLSIVSSLFTLLLNVLFPIFSIDFDSDKNEIAINLFKFFSIELILFTLFSVWIFAFIFKNKGKLSNVLKWFIYGITFKLSLLLIIWNI